MRALVRAGGKNAKTVLRQNEITQGTKSMSTAGKAAITDNSFFSQGKPFKEPTKPNLDFLLPKQELIVPQEQSLILPGNGFYLTSAALQNPALFNLLTATSAGQDNGQRQSSSNAYTAEDQQLNILTQILFHLVFRDDTQGKDQNKKTDRTHPVVAEAYRLWNELNEIGSYKFAGYIEAGGQSYGSTVMSYNSILKILLQFIESAPDTEIRSLARAVYVNSTFPHSAAGDESDLYLSYKFLHDVVDKLVERLFDYNCNIEEMQPAIDVLLRLKAKIEFAIPHSPEGSYQPHFRRSVEKIAKIAGEYGADIAIKRMVDGLTPQEVYKFADFFFITAMQNGIKRATLHAHGEVNDAAAAFILKGVEHQIPVVGVDIIHKGSGGFTSDGKLLPGTFPHIEAICKKLAESGLYLPISARQWESLRRIDELFQSLDITFSAAAVGKSHFTTPDKVKMGLPNGGESHTIAALHKKYHITSVTTNAAGEKQQISEQLSLTEQLGISFEKLCDLFVPCYIQTRERFGGVTSVTPGHYRIQNATIKLIQNTIGSFHALAAEKQTQIQKVLEIFQDQNVQTAQKIQALEKYPEIVAQSGEILKALVILKNKKSSKEEKAAALAEIATAVKEYLDSTPTVALLTRSEVKEMLDKENYTNLFQDMDPATVDAFRNRFTPSPIPDAGFEFLCQEHMRNILKLKVFENVTPEKKNLLIANAADKNAVRIIAEELVNEEILPGRVLTPDSKTSREIESLIQAAGLRIYLESASSKNKAPEYRETLKKYKQEGIDIGDEEEALYMCLITADPLYVKVRALIGPSPSPEGLSKAQYEKALANHDALKMLALGGKWRPGDVIPGREGFLTGAEGFSAVETLPEPAKGASFTEKMAYHNQELNWTRAIVDASGDVRSR